MKLSDLQTVFLDVLLAINPDTTTFPLNYQLASGLYASSVSRIDLQAELNSRAPIQNQIYGLPNAFPPGF